MVIFGSRDGEMFKTAFVTFVCIFVCLFQVFYASASFWFTYVTTDKLALVTTAIYLVSLQIPVLTNVVIIVMPFVFSVSSPVMCNICKGTDHKANACLLSWAREVPTILPHDENCVPPTLPNDDNTENRTGDNICDVSDEDDDDILHESPIDDEDVFLAELSSKPANDDVVSVANPGILSIIDDSLTKDVLTVDMADPQPVEDSPHLFSVDATQDKTVTPQPTIRSSGRKPVKVLAVTIPLHTPTQSDSSYW